MVVKNTMYSECPPYVTSAANEMLSIVLKHNVKIGNVPEHKVLR